MRQKGALIIAIANNSSLDADRAVPNSPSSIDPFAAFPFDVAQAGGPQQWVVAIYWATQTLTTVGWVLASGRALGSVLLLCRTGVMCLFLAGIRRPLSSAPWS